MTHLQSALLLPVIILIGAFSATAQTTDSIMLRTPGGNLYGTLQLPKHTRKKVPVVLIIPGSGPADRNGNGIHSVNNSLKYLADSLALHGIASLRYDKRGIGASKAATKGEQELRFDDYISDAAGWIQLLDADRRFRRIVIFGHNEGALIGMLALQHAPVAGLITASAPSLPGDQIIMHEFKAAGRMPPDILDSCRRMLATLKSGGHIDSVHRGLMATFRPGVQGYLASWIKYDPRAEIAKVTVPVLVIEGTHDLMTDTTDAAALVAAQPDAKELIIDGMNYMLRDAPADRNANMDTYNKPGLPVNKELITAVAEFVKAAR